MEQTIIVTLNDGIRAKKHKYIAFHQGYLLSDPILIWIIGAAVRGLMTTSGAKLLLIPDTRIGPPDLFGLRQIGKFRKSDCVTLKQLIFRIRKSKGLRKTPKNGQKS